MFTSRMWLLALAVVPALASNTARAQSAGEPFSDKQAATAATPIVESIYNFRSIRVSRTAPTVFCQATGWPVLYEDTFDAYSYRTRAVDGLVVETATQKVGAFKACLGVKTLSPFVLNFFAEFDIGELHIVGVGECAQQFANFPVAGAGFYNCIQSLSSPGYVGGQLVTSTATGPAPIEDSDPNVLGIHETSFATIRLWQQP
jgi:hypothetical protein